MGHGALVSVDLYIYIYLIKAKGLEATYIAVQLQSTNEQYARLLT